jgi:hypothetical protein
LHRQHGEIDGARRLHSSVVARRQTAVLRAARLASGSLHTADS